MQSNEFPKGFYTGVVNLWDLPSLKIYLKPDFCLEIIEALNSLGKRKIIAKEMGEKISKYGTVSTLSNLRTYNSGKIGLILKISKLLTKYGKNNFDKKNIEKNIIAISYSNSGGQIRNPRTNFDFRNEYGCLLISAILHDGGISKNKKPHYSNKYIKLHEGVYNSAKEIFGDFNISKSYSKGCLSTIYPKVCGVILKEGIGLQYGKKIYNNPTVPEFIFNINNENKGIFLKQAFDDEGTVDENNRRITIQLSTLLKNKIPHLLEDHIKLLNSLSIITSEIKPVKKYFIKNYGEHSLMCGINITGFENLKKFDYLIGFNIDYKKERLKNCLNSYKEKHFQFGTFRNQVLKSMRKIEKNKGFFTRNLIALDLNRGWSRMQQIFDIFIKENKIKEIEKYSGSRAARYILR